MAEDKKNLEETDESILENDDLMKNGIPEEAFHRILDIDKKIEGRKIILVGRSRCGKTTLIRRLHHQDMSYHKTQTIEAYADVIDTPGEYTDTPFFSRGAAICPAYDADIVCFCHDVGNDVCRLPQMFSMSFARPVIGIVTKADTEDCDPSQAITFLENAGARHIVVTSSVTGRGLGELIDLINTIDLDDY
ncbi:MAG TPA: EutP/PduV family microcompartment system protein [Oscillospiraceae bacterium]|jgi:ethanolamine utilization protein EutP|nr:EutP/PduV family microcompartment system protein [Oscillospiraceae bacterium]HRW56522.1 EutP/PduV family microcompartment system protein [Oscillospiraceae bacterium]